MDKQEYLLGYVSLSTRHFTTVSALLREKGRKTNNSVSLYVQSIAVASEYNMSVLMCPTVNEGRI